MSLMQSRFSIQWHHALALLLFVLPWQTRLILHRTAWQGGVWEYGTVGVYATEILLWGVALWYVISRLRKKQENTARELHDAQISNKARLCFGLFALWFIYQIIHAQFPWIEAQALVHFFEAFILWHLITRAHARTRFLQWSFLAGLGTQALFALTQFFTQRAFAFRWLGITDHPAWAGGSAVIETMSGRWLRAYGGLPHPNILGGYMAVGALLVAVQILKMPREKNLREAFGIASLLLFFVALVAGLMVSFSRSAMLALVCGLIIVTWQHLRKRWRHAHGGSVDSHTEILHNTQSGMRRVGMIWFCGVLTASMFVILQPDLFITRARAQTRLEQQSISERIASYKGACEVLRRDGFLGTGLGNYTAVLHVLDSSRPGWEYQPVHNALVLAFLELGLIMSLVLICFLLFAGNTPLLRTRFLAGDWGLFVSLFVLAMFDHYLWSLLSGLVLCAVVFTLIKPKKTKTDSFG